MPLPLVKIKMKRKNNHVDLLLNSVPKHTVKNVLGDLNIKISMETIFRSLTRKSVFMNRTMKKVYD